MPQLLLKRQVGVSARQLPIGHLGDCNGAIILRLRDGLAIRIDNINGFTALNVDEYTASFIDLGPLEIVSQ
jgi:hypothetical protein